MKIRSSTDKKVPSSKTASAASRTGDRSFANQLQASSSALPVGSAAAAPPLHGMDVIAIQGVGAVQAVESDSHPTNTHKIIQDAHDALDELEKLRHAILAGRISEKQLRNLEARLEQLKTKFPDQGLSDIVNDIDLRIQVELAKIQRY
jgi:hypothetical protein